MSRRHWVGAGERRVAVVGGLRTPFVRSAGQFKALTTLDLATAVVAELVQRLGIDPEVIDEVVYGQVIARLETPNVAREVVLGSGLPRDIDGYSVSRACATSTQATISGARAILLGDAEVVIAGGADSLSKVPITVSDAFTAALVESSRVKDPMSKLRAFTKLRPRDLLPNPPALNEYATGRSMGQHTEEMARAWGIGREEQDHFALRSHRRSAAAWEEGVFEDEVMHLPLPPEYGRTVDRDDVVRPDTSLDRLAALRPAFDRRYGTLTAGNSSPLTDGASAVVLIEERRARELGFEPLAFIRAWELVAVDPEWQLLIGPAFVIPRVLERAGLGLGEVDLFDIHEAFAAQTLCVLKALASTSFAEEHLGGSEAVGEIPDEKLNVYGGSVSLGHPFAATGTRQILTMANELARRGGGTAVVTQCAAGGLGAAVLLER